MPDIVELELVVRPMDGDPDQIDQVTQRLAAELRELPVETVAPLVGGSAPSGAKAGDVATLGALALSLAPVVVPALVEFLKAWIGRKEGRTVVIRTRVGTTSAEVEIKSPMSEAEIATLVEQLSRKKRSPAARS